MATHTTGAKHDRRTRNRIYQHIYNTQEFCTKQSLAHDLGYSLPTIYQYLGELMDANLVGLSGEQRYTGGRNANGLTIIPTARLAVGIYITDNYLRLVCTDLRLNELAYRKVSYKLPAQNPNYGAFLAKELESFLDEENIDRARLLGVGIAIPGLISPDGQEVTLAPTLDMRDVVISNLISAIPYPVHIENDATSAGLYEHFMSKDKKNMAYLSLENGVGGAFFANGVNYVGDNRRSAEFGHMCIEPGGILCNCGKQGCLEAYCSAHRVSSALGITIEEFFSKVAEHDSGYEMLLNDVLRHLAIGINNIRMALDCDIVLGGVFAEHLTPYLPLLMQYVGANNTFGGSGDYLRLSVLRKHTASLGAAFYFVQDFLREV